MTTQVATFPVELQDHIIGTLCQDPKSLAACSLVSSHWSDCARKLLFPNFVLLIDVRYKHDIVRISKFRELLHAPHSRLGLYIQRVAIWGPDSPFGGDHSSLVHTTEYEYLSETLQAILPHLPRVRDLRLNTLSWYRVNRTARTQIASLSKVVFLDWHEIYCDCLNELVQFSRQSFLQLESLRLRDLQVNKNSHIERSNLAQTSNWFACLQELAFFVQEWTVPLLNALLSGVIPIQNIHTLDLTVLDHVNLSLIGRLIKATAATLSVIKLLMRPIREDFGQNLFPISLSRNVNLKLLHFETWLNSNDLWWLERIITSASSIRGLEEIRLRFPAFGVHNSFNFDFASLEHLLLAQSAPSTKIVLQCWEDDRRQSPPPLKTLKSSMSELSKRRQVSVVFFDHQKVSQMDSGFLGS